MAVVFRVLLFAYADDVKVDTNIHIQTYLYSLSESAAFDLAYKYIL